MEQELTLTQDRYRMLINQLPFAVEIFAPNGDLQQVNSAFESLWHDKEEDLVGNYNVFENKKIEEMGLLEKVKEAFAGKLKVLEFPKLEFNPKQFGLPGRKRWIQSKGYPIFNEKGKVVNLITITYDLTEENKLKEIIKEYKKKYDNLD
ncbi:MAG: hypothetical protein HeimC3_10600 [Candidatus Heimdallarchaeota archaeon LC_3]|nr:MAG: hypothetical protein HeimC3_10600 [Candidatus Heimdallarchaeota archaeon LC_3]